MVVEHVEFLVEEPSTEAFLRGLLPPMLGEVSFEVYAFMGKSDLLASLPKRLKGYRRWLPETYRVMVVIDRDDEDCKALKDRLESLAREADLPTRARPRDGRFLVVNRLAIEELEAWYFGDWDAVHAAWPKVEGTIPRKRAYRNPDAIKGGTWEALERILQRAGYFSTGLRKIEAARAIAPHLDPSRNRSRSFQVFRDAVLEVARR